MKNLVLVCVIFSSYLGWSQLDDDIPTWTYGTKKTASPCSIDADFGQITSEPLVSSFFGDTILNLKTYVNIDGDFYRDSNNVWLVPSLEDEDERLFFDGNLNNGDTLFFTNPYLDSGLGQAPYLIVDTVDTIVLYNEESAKRLFLSYDGNDGCSNEVWVVGVGNMSKLSEFGCLYDEQAVEKSRLVCYSNQQGLVFEKPLDEYDMGLIPLNYSLCDWNNIFVSEQNPKAKQFFDLKGNPVRELIEIALTENLQGYDLQWTLTNGTGQLLKSVPNIYRSVAASIDVSDLPAGLYFISLVQSGQVLQTEKLIVE